MSPQVAYTAGLVTLPAILLVYYLWCRWMDWRDDQKERTSCPRCGSWVYKEDLL